MRILLVPALLAFVLPLLAQGKGGVGDLMVMPTRVVLEGRERSAEITLRNSGKESCVYRIQMQEMRMLPSGQVEVMPKQDGVATATDLIRFTPKQVELAPGETQAIRIQLRKPEGLKDGEYRSHMVFQGLPPVEPPKPLLGQDDKALTFDIKTVISLSIPIIVRHGETSVAVAMSGLSFHPAPSPETAPFLEFTAERTGNRSVQGEYKVEWLPGSGPARTVLPVAGGVIYTDLARRPMHLNLTDGKGVPFAQGRLKVTYTYKDVKQRPVVATLDLP
jgi:P pilus assembly chaperone PapD